MINDDDDDDDDDRLVTFARSNSYKQSRTC